MKLSSDSSEPIQVVTIYICSLCKDYFDDTTYIINHLLNSHKNESNIKQIQNSLSRDTIRNKSKFNSCVLQMKRLNGLYKCTECPYSSRFSTTTKRHILTHQNKAFTTYKCKFCSYSSIQPFNLKTHVRKVHPDGKPEIKVDPSVVKEMLKKYTDG